VIKLPLILLAIPSVWIGYVAIEPMLYGDFFNGVIYVDYAAHPAMQEMTHHWHSTMHNATGMAIHGLLSVPFALAASGVLLAWFFYTQRPDIPASIQSKLAWLNKVLENKYGFDAFNDKLFAAGSCLLGHKLWQIGDVTIIDGALVNGTANLIGKAATVVRKLQTGLIYHYAFAMIIGVFLMLTFFTKV
jgi:NADH-quinone oxidoreductase subunit L